MLKVKPYGQTKPSYCGPAALKMVLNFYGIKKREEELVKICGTTRKRGTKAAGFKNAARRLSLKIVIKDFADFKDIKFYLKKKVPIIIDWFSVDEGHYSVAVGLNKKYIYLVDPEFGKIRKMEKEKFRRVWFDFPGAYLKKKKEIIIRRMIVIYK